MVWTEISGILESERNGSSETIQLFFEMVVITIQYQRDLTQVQSALSV